MFYSGNDTMTTAALACIILSLFVNEGVCVLLHYNDNYNNKQCYLLLLMQLLLLLLLLITTLLKGL